MEDHALSRDRPDQLADHRLRTDRGGDRAQGQGIRRPCRGGPTLPATGPDVDEAGTTADLPRLLADADVVVLACSLNDTTRGMVDAAFLDAVKPGAILVNVARDR